MKNMIKFLTLFLIAFFLSNCKGVPMVQTTKEIKELKINESKFVNKPLKYLLKEIEPEIKTGIGNNEAGHFYFYFKFITLDRQLKNQGNYDDNVSLIVYVREQIDWEWEKRPKGKERDWTKEDAKKYGDLIVVRIKVIERS